MRLTKPTGEKVTLREFFKEWKEGMKNVSPLQQTQATQWGQIVSFIGILWGIIFSIRIGYWWMSIILFGGMIVLIVQMLGNWQKKNILLEMDKAMDEAQEVNIEDLLVERSVS